MIPQKIKAQYSCKRKRDYVTGFAIIFFFIVVIAELYLIIGVPVLLRREGVLQKHVTKERMGKTIDYYRALLHNLKPANSLNTGEISLTLRTLDLYANYVRSYQDTMTLAQILETTDMLNRYSPWINFWQTKKYVFHSKEIQYDKAIKYLEQKYGLNQEKRK